MTNSTHVQFFQPILNAPIVRRTRRNHGLEHATIHMLTRRFRGLRVAGRSDAGGFILIGDVETDAVVRAVSDALERLRRGERHLAIHPNCGTNLITTGYMTSLVAFLTTQGANRRGDNLVNRIPLMVVGMVMAILVSQPLGTWLQRYVTTDGDPADTEVIQIKRDTWTWLGRPVVVHRVTTRST